MRKAIVVMGVSGCGKSTVGEAIAAKLGIEFQEGDRLHPQSNVEKMAAGIPLNDDDRWPWLDLIAEELRKGIAKGGIVISCSSLKKTYRERLRNACDGDLAFVFLNGSLELLTERMGARTGHFMPLSLLTSQLATLEDPTGEPGVVTVDISHSPEVIVENALEVLKQA
ncbi:gluconokinase [Rhizobium sp. CG4]|uniref:gluconokinase n=1 Tax=Rhizobium sp. CG4 TaxID=2726075 RepID=UPI0020340004|nr:gluconokinase [Rhizobium sp. CG4]